MEGVNILGVLLGSSVISVLITSVFTRKSQTETLSLKYVTEERAKWREEIKTIMAKLSLYINSYPISKAEIRSSSSYLKLCLNHDKKEIIDKSIILRVNKICDNPNYDEFKSLEKEVALLLKHDWERAKKEASSSFSPILIALFALIVVWCSFYMVLKNTAIYTLLQSIPVISGLYSEVTLFFIMVISSFAFWSAVVKPIKQRLLKIKYNEQFKQL